ncbi:MAG: hypothetical protein OXP71_07680 [Candidatus Poribacteria bacterium]|nr:hypothetical protein [Candidatus Poribacteria bacterium]
MFKKPSEGRVKVIAVLLFLTAQVPGISNEEFFVDEFDNRLLPKWNVSDAFPPGNVKVDGGKLILKNETLLKINSPQSNTWLDYTTTLKLRFTQIQERSSFTVNVRHSLGRFNFWTGEKFTFYPHEENIRVNTFRPDKQPLDEEDLRQAVKNHANAQHNFDLKTWFLIVIEIIDNSFTLFIDDKELLSFVDKEAVAGTIGLSTSDEDIGEFRLELDFIRVKEGNELSIKPVNAVSTAWAAIKNSLR